LEGEKGERESERERDYFLKDEHKILLFTSKAFVNAVFPARKATVIHGLTIFVSYSQFEASSQFPRMV
jgi:hypothetical protein